MARLVAINFQTQGPTGDYVGVFVSPAADVMIMMCLLYSCILQKERFSKNFMSTRVDYQLVIKVESNFMFPS